MMPTCKVHIIDDDPSVRKSLSWMLESTELEFQTYASAGDFLEDADVNGPSCLILDMELPGMTGMELLEQLQGRPELAMPVMVLTGAGSIAMAVTAMQLGARDFVQKPIDPAGMLAKIRKLVAIDAVRREALAKPIAAKRLLAQLTHREREVLELLCEGKSTKQMALILQISGKTISIHRGRLLKKMQVSSATELVQLVLRAQAA